MNVAIHSERSERLNSTIDKLEKFRTYEPGWDLGRGEKISEASINAAEYITRFVFDMGVWKSSVFPAPSGSVLLAFPISPDLDIEVYADRDGTFDFSCERAGKPDINKTELSLREILSLVLIYGKKEKDEKWLSEYSIMTSITTTSVEGSGVQLLSLLPTGDYLYSTQIAPEPFLEEFVNISKVIIPELVDPQPITGISMIRYPMLTHQKKTTTPTHVI